MLNGAFSLKQPNVWKWRNLTVRQHVLLIHADHSRRKPSGEICSSPRQIHRIRDALGVLGLGATAGPWLQTAGRCHSTPPCSPVLPCAAFSGQFPFVRRSLMSRESLSICREMRRSFSP